MWRTYGRWLGGPVVLLDVLKGFVPAFLGMLFVSHWAGIFAGGAAMLGHWRPLFLRFAKGGEMVATCGGVFFGVAGLGGADAACSRGSSPSCSSAMRRWRRSSRGSRCR